ncbi:S1 family peptidase [Actinomadura roseirufa]|uniref:S1 family peptidase n=1 Tax=Actinomadura roseirufa TaxID=2094049 RepID=UPI00104106EE|nr:S1 family peptidase [Actinomadura roseirufa]
MRLRFSAAAACCAVVLAALTGTASASPGRAPAPPGGEGGRPVYASDGVRCAIGFNVRKNGSHYFLTAGDCAKVGMRLFADPALTTQLGSVVAVTNGASALVRYVAPTVERPGSVYTYPGSQDITTADRPVVGQRVCRSGPLTGLRCGTVTALNQTVRLPQGTISGLVRTNICIEPRELAGAPYFAGVTAIGLEIGLPCSGSGPSYFQPVSPVLATFSIEVY